MVVLAQDATVSSKLWGFREWCLDDMDAGCPPWNLGKVRTWSIQDRIHLTSEQCHLQWRVPRAAAIQEEI